MNARADQGPKPLPVPRPAAPIPAAPTLKRAPLKFRQSLLTFIRRCMDVAPVDPSHFMAGGGVGERWEYIGDRLGGHEWTRRIILLDPAARAALAPPA